MVINVNFKESSSFDMSSEWPKFGDGGGWGIEWCAKNMAKYLEGIFNATTVKITVGFSEDSDSANPPVRSLLGNVIKVECLVPTFQRVRFCDKWGDHHSLTFGTNNLWYGIVTAVCKNNVEAKQVAIQLAHLIHV